MVLKPLTQFARQAFSKSIAHGYAQSVVAASQSSYASQTGSQIGHHHHPLSQNSKYPRSAQLQQSAGFSSASASSSSAKPHPGSSESSAAALAAYHAAYQQAQIAEEKKFRKLGWTPLSKEAQAEQDLQQAQLEAEGGKELDSRTSQPGRTSPHNSEHNLLQTDSSSNNVVINADVSARVDEAVAREMRELEERDAEDYNDELPRRKSEAYIAEPERVATLATPLAPFSTLGHHSQPAASPAAAARSEYIVTLALTHQWSRVPSAFESMLDEHLLPTPQAYNALLYAAVRLCVDLHHAVPKALDIYSDMLRRNVLPDAETYQILIPLLASRALACLDQRKLLEQQRLRFGGDSASGRRGGFTLRSSEAEHALLVEDHSLHIVLKLFSTAISRHPDITFTTTLDTKTSETGKNGSSVSDPTPVYTSLINICARTGNLDAMISIMAHMEAHNIPPHASMFPAMIDAFAESYDLKSAVECYNEYKSLAIADDAGDFVIVDRADAKVYASLVRAYLACDRLEGGMRFMSRIMETVAEDKATVHDAIVRDALVQHAVDTKDFSSALEIAQAELTQGSSSYVEALTKICIAAADANDLATASSAYALLGADNASLDPVVSMLALHVRRHDVRAAQPFWEILRGTGARVSPAMIHPTAMYAVAMLEAGQVEKGVIEARNMFARIRESVSAGSPSASPSFQGKQQSQLQLAQVKEEVEETIDLLGDVLARIAPTNPALVSPTAATNLLWAMVENGGLVSPVAENLIAGFGPEATDMLRGADLALALQVQANVLAALAPSNGTAAPSSVNLAHAVRFAYMLDAAMVGGMTAESLRHPAVEASVGKMVEFSVRPDVVGRWQQYVGLNPVLMPAVMPFVAPPAPMPAAAGPAAPTQAPAVSPITPISPISPLPGKFMPAAASPAVPVPVPTPTAVAAPKAPEDTFDPYARTTDFRGSSQIAEELENPVGRPQEHLHEALSKFRSIRRLGRHPRYITYAKLITAAAKCNRMNIAHEILSMARHDVPLLPQYALVKYGWTSILDAMVAACLTCGGGYRAEAGKYHQELLSIGAAPSANTFGLYITTLKESATKTFDEATEAVKIFQRAKAEGVEPTSFLYNALIGKLGKARRIDDCLTYFAEMRLANVRPTSVTYGTIVNALCRVSDERFAEELFDEMEAMPNYKPRPAPYNSLIQFFLNTKRDRVKVLAYYERMLARGIKPTMHTYKLLIDAYASLEPVRMDLAEEVLETIRKAGMTPEPVHFASLIHAKGCVMHDLAGAREIFDRVVVENKDNIALQPCLYQALFESLVANHEVAQTQELLDSMRAHAVEMTPYIANTLIHGWAAEGNIGEARKIYDDIGVEKREPSTYEAMTRAYLAVEQKECARDVVAEMVSRGYPPAVTGKVLELIGGALPAVVPAMMRAK